MLDTELHRRYGAASRLSEQGHTKDQDWSQCKGQFGAHPIYNQSIKHQCDAFRNVSRKINILN
jgi:hypothetical protein